MEFSVGQLVSHSYSKAVGVVIKIVPAEKKYPKGKIVNINLHKYKAHYLVMWFGHEGLTNLMTDFYIEAYDNGV